MGKMSRRKGVEGEHEVAEYFRAAGFDLYALEYGGDWSAVHHTAEMPSLHLEVKRAEQLRLREWLAQVERESARGAIPILAFRQSRQPWRVIVRLDDFLRLLP